VERDFGDAAPVALARLAYGDEASLTARVVQASGDLHRLAEPAEPLTERALDWRLGPQQLFAVALPGWWEVRPAAEQAWPERELTAQRS